MAPSLKIGNKDLVLSMKLRIRHQQLLLKTRLLKHSCILAIILANAVMQTAHSDMSGMFKVHSPHHDFSERVNQQTRSRHEILSKYWDSESNSRSQIWVSYSDDLLFRRMIDFNKNQVSLSYQGAALAESNPASIKEDLEGLLAITFQDAYRSGENFIDKRSDAPKFSMSFLNLDQTVGLYGYASFDRKKGVKGDVLTVTVPLPKNSIETRSEIVRPIVESLGEQKGVDPALVMAIIHQQSGFNALATSSKPRLGLMQLDAKYLVNPLQPQAEIRGGDVYDPYYNIERGIDQLAHIQEQLSGIADEEVRRLCVIAAYSVGVSDLARLFTGKPSLEKALSLINRLSKKQVQGQLYGQLQQVERPNYIQNISSFLAIYDDA